MLRMRSNVAARWCADRAAAASPACTPAFNARRATGVASAARAVTRPAGRMALVHNPHAPVFGASSSAACGPLPLTQRRAMWNPFAKKKEVVSVEEAVFDKERSHYQGFLFGVPVDKLAYYLKLNSAVAAVCFMIYMFFKGYVWMSQFSLATVGRMGFGAGFWTCMALTGIVTTVKRNYQINPNAVYNQAIAMVMKNPEVAKFLGQTPKTGDFRAYCATGGFKLPLMRRLRSGSYELGDLLGTKERRLQMMFVLYGDNGRSGLVSCDVRRGGAGLYKTYYFKSLAVHLNDEVKDVAGGDVAGSVTGKHQNVVLLVGGEEDVVWQGFMKF